MYVLVVSSLDIRALLRLTVLDLIRIVFAVIETGSIWISSSDVCTVVCAVA
jgi:hypothetical protein